MSRNAISALLLGFALGCGPGYAQNSQLPDKPGKDTFLRVCGACHSPEMVVGKGNTRDGWTQLTGEMISRGAQGSDDDFATVADYLTANFPPNSDVKKVNVNQAAAPELQSVLQLTADQAGAIVDYRKQHGKFKTLDDLKKVQGLDPAKVDSNRDKIAF